MRNVSQVRKIPNDMSDGDGDDVVKSEGVQKPMDVAENSGSEDVACIRTGRRSE
jgi:hypothetical protein